MKLKASDDKFKKVFHTFMLSWDFSMLDWMILLGERRGFIVFRDWSASVA